MSFLRAKNKKQNFQNSIFLVVSVIIQTNGVFISRLRIKKNFSLFQVLSCQLKWHQVLSERLY